MAIEIKVPSVGESVREAILAEWYKKDGDTVKKDEPLFVIETDKVTLEVNAETDGVLSIKTAEGETVAVGAVVGAIEPSGGAAEPAGEKEEPEPEKQAEKAPPEKERKPDEKQPEPEASREPSVLEGKKEAPEKEPGENVLLPAARRLVREKGLDASKISGTGPSGRITKGDVILYLERGTAEAARPEPDEPADRKPKADADEDQVTRKPMSPIRRKIADHLLKARQNTAMLTTFNEIDMSRVMAIREEYKDSFKKKYGVSLGFMSFFIKASVEALKEFPAINAFIDGDDIVYHHYYHIGVAIGSPRGLVVPVIKHAEQLGFADFEKAVIGFVDKIGDNKLELSDLEGGTFTITNGGVFGSLLSTPILNAPQSGILGMHKIEKRPVVIGDEIVIQPMMYVALSYDHRIVDGRDAVTCLKRIKEFIENPERMMMGI